MRAGGKKDTGFGRNRICQGIKKEGKTNDSVNIVGVNIKRSDKFAFYNMRAFPLSEYIPKPPNGQYRKTVHSFCIKMQKQI